MKIGYSILLGETMKADGIEYHDCEHFQIVCPACREPIFKGVRKADEHELHYLSHYAANKAYAADCEMRVGGLKSDQIERDNRSARDQRLDYFLGVLKRTVGFDPMYQRGWEKSHYTVNKGHAMSVLCNATLVTTSRDVDDFFKGSEETVIATLKATGWEIKTTFGEAMQRRIALDMWRTLHTPAARGNYSFLFTHAWLKEMAGWMLRPAGEEGEERFYSKAMADYMTACAVSSKGNTSALLQEMAARELPTGYNRLVTTGDEDTEKSSFLTRILGNVSAKMVETLLALPYQEMLKAQYGAGDGVVWSAEAIRPASDEAKAAFKAPREFADGTPYTPAPRTVN